MNGSPDNQENRFVKFLGSRNSITVSGKLYGIGDEDRDQESHQDRNAGSCNCPIHPYRCLFVDRHRNEFDIHEFFSDHAGCFLVLVLILILLGTIGPFLIK